MVNNFQMLETNPVLLTEEPVTAEEEFVVSLSPLLTEVIAVEITPDRIEQIKSLIGGEIESFRILSAGTVAVRDERGNVTWQSPDYTQVENNTTGLASGAIARVAAGIVLSSVYSDANIVVGSSYFDPDEDKPHPYEVMSKELELAEIPPEKLKIEPVPVDTIGELISFLNIAEEQDFHQIALITNEYHLERAKLIIKNLHWLSFPEERTEKFNSALKRLSSGDLKLKLVSAEKIISCLSNDIYARHIEGYQSGESIENRLRSEIKGIEAINNGIYLRNVLGTREKRRVVRSN